jgi:hypothetical protein
VSTQDFLQWRIDALKYFFRHKLGWQWQRKVAVLLGRKELKDIFRYTTKDAGRFTTLLRIEAVALQLGWNPAGPLGLMRPSPKPTVFLSSERESSAAAPSTSQHV